MCYYILRQPLTSEWVTSGGYLIRGSAAPRLDEYLLLATDTEVNSG